MLIGKIWEFGSEKNLEFPFLPIFSNAIQNLKIFGLKSFYTTGESANVDNFFGLFATHCFTNSRALVVLHSDKYNIL